MQTCFSCDVRSPAAPRGGVGRIGWMIAAVCAVAMSVFGLNAGAAEERSDWPDKADFGPNVIVFDPGMPLSEIKAKVDAIAGEQLTNEFGSQRYALLFRPGTYGSSTSPLNFQVGYYTAVAGLGRSPTDVVINGSINVYNRCRNGVCFALDNFWRSLSNLTINVTDPPGAGCYAGNFWAVSQAAPMRRVNITGGNLTLMDYCTGPSFASGGYIADSQAGLIINGSQQQFLVRNSSVATWTNGVWNQVFSGVVGAPGECFPATKDAAGNVTCGPYTTLATSPVTREAPFLTVDARGRYKIIVPSVRRNSVGTSWGNAAADPSAKSAESDDDYFVARPADSAGKINKALARGQNLIFTPGIYHLDRTIEVRRAGTVVLGLGLPTLIPDGGQMAMRVADVRNVVIAGVLFDAGPVNSPVLLQVGTARAHKSDPDKPTLLADVFFRIGGAGAGKATVSLEVNSDDVILDDLWVWRADHGSGVGWALNTADTGVIINGDDVTAYGLFVEHYQKHNAIWNGNGGRVIFFQNEMPYDPPSQAAWMQAPGVYGWSALKVSDKVRRFNGWGMGSYSFFNQGLDIFAANAYEVPATLAPGSLHNLLTIFLDPSKGRGGILNVVNGIGGPSTIANPDVPVTVVNYP